MASHLPFPNSCLAPSAMASPRQLPPPQKKKSPPPADTTISNLSDDVLRKIFLRLPSLPGLVRAALTCRAFLRAVRSCPVFRRRFRELHPPPLIGLFLDTYETEIPAFSPLRLGSNPDLAAVIRGADFFLTRLPNDGKSTATDWQIRGSHDGYVIFISFDISQVAVYNPITLAMDLLPCPPGEICEEMYVEFHVLSSEEDCGSFRVICVCHAQWGAQAAVFSSDSRKWQVFPFVEAASMHPDLQSDEDEYCFRNGMLANGFIYWTQGSRANTRVLNTSTLQFSRIQLPLHIEGQKALSPGGTKDGKLCMVCLHKLTLIVWLWTVEDDGVERWMLDRTFLLSQKINAINVIPADLVVLDILATIDGFVYLSLYRKIDLSSSGWFLSFCLETAELNKLCPIWYTSTDYLYPYIMAWPPSLVLNKAYTLSR